MRTRLRAALGGHRTVALALAITLGAAACGSDSADDAGSGDAATDAGEDMADDGEDMADDGDMADDDGDMADDDGDMAEGHGGMVDLGRTLAAPAATITVDGDAADWADVPVLDVTLEAISDEDVPSLESTIRVAHDDENIYVLFEVQDDYNWDADDAHLSGSSAIMWAIEDAAAPHMGAEDDEREVSLGAVDIWHWELECAAGEQMGGAVSDAGEGDPGNDAGCNFDDEWATTPEEREDDNSETGENSLLGVFTHSAAEQDADGTWTFEISRPLNTGDQHDAQFEAGGTYKLALAYWDADTSVEGWDDDKHVQSSNQGWIQVTLA